MAAKPKPQAGPDPAEYTTAAKPKAYADGVPVFCAHDAIVPISELRPNPRNPNQHPPEQIKLLGSIIRATGWRDNITVSTRSGLIVKGHGRLMAAELYDLKEAPVDYQEYTSEAEELADLTADNRLAELAHTDNRMLADLFVDIDTGEIPFMLSGYTEEDYGNIVAALSEALHDQQEADGDDGGTGDDDVGEDGTEGSKDARRMAQAGDLWIINDKERRVEPGLLDHIKATAGTARIIIVEVAPRLADATLEEITKATGPAGVRCVRQGRELAPAAVADLLAPDEEGGGQE
ncbi:ParB/Srx family N-terminal domain-containing protein [Gemmiger formicilis]